MADLIDASKHPFAAKLLNWFLVFGAVMGVFGTLLGLFQTWFKTPDDQKIAVALDVSRSYLREITPEMVDLLSKGADATETLTAEQQLRLARYSDVLEYYARLANKGKLDTDFMSRALVCAIVFGSVAAERYKFSIPTGGNPLEMIQFAKTAKCGGPTYKLN